MGFEPRQPSSSLETVNKFIDWIKVVAEEAKSAIYKAQEDMARYYNQRRSPAPVFKPGNRVFLDASNICTTQPSAKLCHKKVTTK